MPKELFLSAAGRANEAFRHDLQENVDAREKCKVGIPLTNLVAGGVISIIGVVKTFTGDDKIGQDATAGIMVLVPVVAGLVDLILKHLEKHYEKQSYSAIKSGVAYQYFRAPPVALPAGAAAPNPPPAEIIETNEEAVRARILL